MTREGRYSHACEEKVETERYSAGSWAQEGSNESSNWREAMNLKLKVEELAAEGRLDNKELWVFTDNSLYEITSYKGCTALLPNLRPSSFA